MSNGCSADEDDARHAKLCSILEPLTIGCEMLFAGGFLNGCKESSTNVGDGHESGVGVLLADGFEVLAFDGFAPDGDAANVSLGVSFDALGDGPRLGGEGVKGDVLVAHGM